MRNPRPERSIDLRKPPGSIAGPTTPPAATLTPVGRPGLPTVPRRVLIDSDANNEIDDQYAIVRALIAPELSVEGLTAAGYHDRENGARLSYDEEVRLLDLMGLRERVPVALGSALPMVDRKTPRPSPAAELIIERALARDDAPLIVLALGQFTNLASALLMEPRIRDHVVFACIDGDYRHGHIPAWGPGVYNWKNDVAAVQAIFESDVRYTHMPARSVSGRMYAERELIEEKLMGRGGVYDYLVSLWDRDRFSKLKGKILWDIALVHVVIDPAHGTPVQAPAPLVHDNGRTTDRPDNPRTMTVYADIDPDVIYASFWQAVDAAAPRPLARPEHGPAPTLKLSNNGRFIVTREGKPFFWLGDTAWELFRRPSHQDVDLYLETRAEQQFTVIQAVVIGEICGASGRSVYGELPLRNNDPTQPNEAYFANVDTIVDKAESLGLHIGMLPTWGDHVSPLQGQETRRFFTPQSAAVYGEWLGRRYRTKPIIWILGGDHNPTSKEVVTWRAMAEGLARGDGGTHLMTYHPRGGAASSTFLQAEPWLDLNMVQSGHSRRDAANYAMIAADYAKEPARPCLDGEPCYEDHPLNWKPENGYFDDHDVRKAAYRALFAGAFGHTYGSNPVWQFYEPPRKPITGARTPWREGLQSAGANQMRHTRALLESRPFLSRIPDQSLLVSPVGTGANRVQATRDADGSYVFVYLPKGEPVRIDLGKLSGQRVRVTWFDPRTGAAHVTGEFATEGPPRDFTPPAKGPGNDWVLVLDDPSRDYPLPGTTGAATR